MALSVERLQEEDIPETLELKDSHGWNQLPGDLRRFLRLSGEGCFKAVAEGRLVGTCLVFIFDRIGWIALMVVRREFQRRGIGRALMERSLEFCDSKGISLIKLDGTREGYPLYRSVGFQEEFPVGMARAGVDDLRAPAPAKYNLEYHGSEIRRVGMGDLEALAALDRRACGINREELIRQLLLDYPGRGLISESDGPSGFVLFRPGSHSVQIGPLIASGEGEARALLARAIGRIRGEERRGGLTLSVSLRNPDSLRLFEAMGFSCTHRLTRMRRGEGLLQCDEDILYAYSGPEKG